MSVQGENLGLYTHIEAIKKPFLKQAFGNDDGNLYEMQRNGEFDTSHLPYFELKTNEKANDRSDLEAVILALESPDEDLWESLEPLINLEQFALFSAVEALVGHTDGYTGFQNNTYLYHNSSDDRLYFIPWGTDQTFVKTHVVNPEDNVPALVMLGSVLIQRLWNNTAFRSEYENQMRTLLSTVWDETALKAEVDRMGQLLHTPDNATKPIHDFIDERRTLVEAGLAGSSVEWQWPLLPEVNSCPIPTPISGDFDIAFGEVDGGHSFNLNYDGVAYSGDSGYAGVESRDENYFQVTLVGFSNANDQLDVIFDIPKKQWKRGEVPFHSIETVGYVGRPQEDGWEFLGMISDGGVNFSAISTVPGGSITGTFEAVTVIPD